MPSASCLVHNYICQSTGTKHMVSHTLKSKWEAVNSQSSDKCSQSNLNIYFEKPQILNGFFSNQHSFHLVLFSLSGLYMNLTWLMLLRKEVNKVTTSAHVKASPVFSYFGSSRLLVCLNSLIIAEPVLFQCKAIILTDICIVYSEAASWLFI